MHFTALPAGTSVYVDANVFVYSYAADPTFGAVCTDLLERIELKDLQGYLSTHAFSEIAHRLMTLEACQAFGWSYTGIARRLRRHPADVQKLQEFRKTLDDVIANGLEILPVHAQNILSAGDLSLQHGLLSSDALVVAMMQANGLAYLASNDADFDRIPGITRVGPL